MNVQKESPAPIGQTNSDPLDREKGVQTILLGLAGVTILLLVFSLLDSKSGVWLFAIIYLASCIGFFSLLLIKTIPGSIRTTSLLFITFLLGMTEFFRSGWNEIPLLLLLGFSGLCSLLLERKRIWVGQAAALMALLTGFLLTFLKDNPDVSTKNLIAQAVLFFLLGLVANKAAILTRNDPTTISTDLPVTDGNQQIIEIDTGNKQTQVTNDLGQAIITKIIQLALATHDVQTLLKNIADLLQEKFALYYVGVFLIDHTSEYLVLHYGTGDQGRQMLMSSYRLSACGYSTISRALQNQNPKLTRSDDPQSLHFDNLYLPESKTELALPLISHGTPFGALDIHATQPSEFNHELVMFFEQIANLLSLVLERNPAVSKPLDAMREADQFTRSLIGVDASETSDNCTQIVESYQNPSYPLAMSESTIVEIPLMLHEEKIGQFEIEIQNEQLSADQTEFLEAIAAQTVMAIENANLIEKTVRQAEREARILEITSKIRSTNDSQKMLQVALEELSRSLGVSRAQIVFKTPEPPRIEDPDESDTRALTRERTTGKLRGV